MRKKLLGILSVLILSVMVLSGCADKELNKIIETYNAVSVSTVTGFETIVNIKRVDIEYTSYDKKIEYNGSSYKVTESETVLNEVGASEPTTTTTEVYYIDNGYIIGEGEGGYIKGEQVELDFECKFMLNADHFVEYTIEKNDKIKTLTAQIKSESFNSFTNMNLTDVASMTITITLLSDRITNIALDYTKTDGSAITITTRLSSRVATFSLPEYQE